MGSGAAAGATHAEPLTNSRGGRRLPRRLALCVGHRFFVLARALADLGDLLLVLEAVVGDCFFEVGHFDGDVLLGGFDLELAVLAHRQVVVEGLEGGAGSAFLALDELGVGLLHLEDAELAGGAEDLDFLLSEGLALLEEVVLLLALELGNLLGEIDFFIGNKFDVLFG